MGSPMSGQPFELRPYQAEAIRAVIAAYRAGISSALITLPTGAGKTVVFSEIARRIMPRRTLIIAHREELLAQAASKIAAVAGIVPGMEKGRMRSAPGDVIITASVQSLARGRKIPGDPFGLCVIDEAHHAPADSYQDGRCPLRSTLRPWRNGDALPERHAQIVERFRKERLHENDPRPYRSGLSDRYCNPDPPSQNRPVARQYKTGRFQRRRSRGGARSHDRGISGNRGRGIFRPQASDLLSPSRNLEALDAGAHRVGLPAAHVDGDSPDRKEILDAYSRDDIRFLSNASLLTEGYDEPSIDTILILRSTKNRALYSQMIGRGTRLFKGKDRLLVLDPVFLSERHNILSVADLVAEDDETSTAVGELMRNRGLDLKEAAGLNAALQRAKLAAALKMASDRARLRNVSGRSLSQSRSPRTQELETRFSLARGAADALAAGRHRPRRDHTVACSMQGFCVGDYR